MSRPTQFDFTRYLDAKRAIDNRALNTHVWIALQRTVASHPRAAAPLRVLELGAGTGSMIERLAKVGILDGAEYIAVEESAESVRAGVERLRAWAEGAGLRCETVGANPQRWAITGKQVDVRIEWVNADVFRWLPAHSDRVFDLIVAHAFLDLVDVPRLLALLMEVTRPATIFYFSLNFDGATLLLPEYGGGVDDGIESLYHATMDNRRTGGNLGGQPAGHSRTGRRLFAWMRDAGIAVQAAGSSDWVVHAENGGYPGDAAYFLHHILHFFESSLRDAPGLEPGLLAQWLEHRRSQIERGELVYVAHQLDMLGVRQ